MGSLVQEMIAMVSHCGLWIVFAKVLALHAGAPAPAYPALAATAAPRCGPGPKI
jgi:hypothetical protein